jgi:hypothetical protein
VTNPEDIAAVLALVSSQPHVVPPDLPVPPNGASVRAQQAWYQVLGHVDLETVAEWRLLESIMEVITQYDAVKAEWEGSGGEITSTGSMGQDVEHPALGTMQKLRSQEAALWKQLALPSSASEAKRRPGRPSRSQAGGRWGTAQ